MYVYIYICIHIYICISNRTSNYTLYYIIPYIILYDILLYIETHGTTMESAIATHISSEQDLMHLKTTDGEDEIGDLVKSKYNDFEMERIAIRPLIFFDPDVSPSRRDATRQFFLIQPIPTQPN